MGDTRGPSCPGRAGGRPEISKHADHRTETFSFTPSFTCGLDIDFVNLVMLLYGIVGMTYTTET